MSSSAPTSQNPSDKDAVVITGISGRFPKSKNIQEFWDKLMAGKVMNSADDRRWPVGELIYSWSRLIKNLYQIHYDLYQSLHDLIFLNT